MIHRYLVIVLFSLIGTLSTPSFALDGAPDFTLPGETKDVSLQDYRGKVVYLDFWASWCSPCRDSFPWMNEMQKKYQAKGVEFIAINVDQKKREALDFLKDNPVNFTIAFDKAGKTPKDYALMGMPSAFIIGRDGAVLYSHIGFTASDAAKYEEHIKSAISH